MQGARSAQHASVRKPISVQAPGLRPSVPSAPSSSPPMPASAWSCWSGSPPAARSAAAVPAAALPNPPAFGSPPARSKAHHVNPMRLPQCLQREAGAGHADSARSTHLSKNPLFARPRHVEVLPRVSPLQVAQDVRVVVPDDAEDEVAAAQHAGGSGARQDMQPLDGALQDADPAVSPRLVEMPSVRCVA